MITFEKYLSMTDVQKSAVKSEDFDAKNLADAMVQIVAAVNSISNEPIRKNLLALCMDREFLHQRISVLDAHYDHYRNNMAAELSRQVMQQGKQHIDIHKQIEARYAESQH